MDLKFWISDWVGLQNSDIRFWISDFGFQILYFVFQILYFTFWISDFGFQVLNFRFQTVFKCLISDLSSRVLTLQLKLQLVTAKSGICTKVGGWFKAYVDHVYCFLGLPFFELTYSSASATSAIWVRPHTPTPLTRDVILEWSLKVNIIIIGASKKAQIKVERRHPKLDYESWLRRNTKIEPERGFKAITQLNFIRSRY